MLCGLGSVEHARTQQFRKYLRASALSQGHFREHVSWSGVFLVFARPEIARPATLFCYDKSRTPSARDARECLLREYSRAIESLTFRVS